MSKESEDKNWTIEWMQKSEVLFCVVNRLKELQNGAESRSEEDTLRWFLDRAENNMIGLTEAEVASISGGNPCCNSEICPFFNKVISEDTQIE